jgi:hypothetical protein
LQLANLLNADFFLPGKRLDYSNIGMVAGVNARAIRAAATEIAIPYLAMNGFSYTIGKRLLTHALRADKKIGVMEPAMGQRLAQHR